MVQAHTHVVLGFVGVGEIDKAKAAFEALQKVASADWVRSRLEGSSGYRRPEDRRRVTTFLRVAAGLEDPSAAGVSGILCACNPWVTLRREPRDANQARTT
jgi:hypothetical protein